MKKTQIPALVVMLALLVLWQVGAMQLNAAYILPTPMQILEKIWELRIPLFTAHLPATLLVTAIGLVISILFGLMLAILMDASPAVSRAIYPIIIASQTIPTTALAPLFVLWFGYSIWSKVLVTVLITFFPITITVYDGLRSVRTDMVELMQTYGASRIQIFCKLKMPWARWGRCICAHRGAFGRSHAVRGCAGPVGKKGDSLARRAIKGRFVEDSERILL